MTVVFLARLFAPHIGGVEKHVHQISKILISKGCKVIIITELYSKDLAAKEIIDGITIYRINVGNNDWFKKIRIWREIWKLKKIILSADVIHCHDVFFWYLPFRFITNKPVYTTFHGYESYPIKSSAKFLRKISEKLSRGNICIGDFIKKWYGTEPTLVSYGATEVAYSKSGTTRNIIKESKNLSALFIGRLDEQTGILTYVKAFEILKNKYPEFDFTIAGDGKYREILEDKVKILGFKENPEKYFIQYRYAFVSRYLSIFRSVCFQKTGLCSI